MPKNLELKSRVSSFDKIREKLIELGASYEGILDQCDVYYEVEKFKLKLRIENERSQLIKYIRDEKSPDRWSNYELLEVIGSDPRVYLGDFLREITVVEKKRILYIYDNTRIHFDEVKDLGKFIELETVVGKNDEDAQRRFNKLVAILELDLAKQIKCGYKELLEDQ